MARGRILLKSDTLFPVISPQRILYSDNHLLAVGKLSGELVVAGARRLKSGHTADASSLPLLDFLKKDYPGLRPLHRLDFETSGVVLFARTKQAAEAVMKSKFNGWEKTYVALVAGRIDRRFGDITTPLPARGEGIVPAVTRYRVLQTFANSTLVEATMQTGRHHQIRRHFAGIGHPLLLDEEYGNKGVNRVFSHEFKLHRFFLHAAKLSLSHPVTGEKIGIEASLPRVFEGVLKRLRIL